MSFLSRTFLAAPKGGDGKGQEMNLNDLEGHLNALKEMFIQKQKMMDELEKVTDAPPAGI